MMQVEQMQALFRTILAGWATQRQKLSDEDVTEMTKLYSAGLMDLDFDIAYRAVVRIVHTSKFLPTVAEIREAAGILKHGNRRTGAEAWGEVIAKIRRYGWQREPGVDFFFEDPLTERVVRAFNWEILCAGEGDSIVADRARFITAYEEMASAARADAAASPNLSSDMLTMRTSMPAKALPAPKPLLSAADRIQALQEVLNEARALNPDVANALPPGPSKIEVDEVIAHAQRLHDEKVAAGPECDCVEIYLPLTWDGRCPNCNGFRADEHGIVPLPSHLKLVGDR